MRPIEFPGQNVVFAKDQPQYQPLPALRLPCGEVITCWGLSWRERWRLLVSGRIYLSQLTFYAPLLQLPSVELPAQAREGRGHA
jgi:hypothetical protein